MSQVRHRLNQPTLAVSGVLPFHAAWSPPAKRPGHLIHSTIAPPRESSFSRFGSPSMIKFPVHAIDTTTCPPSLAWPKNRPFSSLRGRAPLGRTNPPIPKNKKKKKKKVYTYCVLRTVYDVSHPHPPGVAPTHPHPISKN